MAAKIASTSALKFCWWNIKRSHMNFNFVNNDKNEIKLN